MGDDILAVRDAVRDLLVANLEPAEPDRVKAVYAPKLDAVGWDGWRYWVYPAAYRDSERLSRGAVKTELRILVEPECRYDEAGSAAEDGTVPPEWADDRIREIGNGVFDLLNDTGVRKATLLAGRFRCEACEMQAVYDPVRLHQDKVFACLIEVTYSEPVTG
jgi:hypothetical protein